MRGVSGCLVCDSDHRASENNTPSEVTATVRELMEKVPSALITVDDLDAVVRICTNERELAESVEVEEDIYYAEEEDGNEKGFGFLSDSTEEVEKVFRS